MNDKKQSSNNDGPLLVIVCGFVAIAAITQKQEQIKLWFFEHSMTLALLAFILVGLLVLWAVHKMKKNEAEFLARIKANNSVKPTRNQMDYYKRRQD